MKLPKTHSRSRIYAEYADTDYARTSCGQEVHRLRGRLRREFLLMAKRGEAPTCQRCRTSLDVD